MGQKVFFLSGLGADQRAFESLELNCKDRIVHVNWLSPSNGEILEHYSNRLIEKYNISSDDVIVGLSFGGLVAVELQRILTNNKVVLISSASCRKELHPFIRLITSLGLTKVMPKNKLNQPNAFLHKGFSIKNESDKQLLNAILKDTDVNFAQWAITTMGYWKVKERASGIIKIHGDCDRMIPLNNNASDYTVKGGGHFMVVDRSEEISALLNQIV